MTLDTISLDFLRLPSPLELVDPDYKSCGVELYIKRDELIHPLINGNKWRKLSLTFHQALQNNKSTVLSFGGSFSNHLVAVACLAKQLNLKSIGVVRSHKPDEDNPTIKLLGALGMKMLFLSPSGYREMMKSENDSYQIDNKKDVIVIPEGGTNELGALGAMKIMKEVAEQTNKKFDFIVVSVGTGGTLAGISKNSPGDSIIYAMLPFKGVISQLEGHKWIDNIKNIEWINVSQKSRFGSYQHGVSSYINQFYKDYKILLDPIYTARAMRGLDESILAGRIPHGSKVLFIHTGGLQGIMGYNYFYSEKEKIEIPSDYQWLANPLTTFG